MAEKLKEAHTVYEDSVIKANSILAKYANQYYSMTVQVTELENKRVNLTKNALNKYAELLKSLSAVCLNEAEKLQNQANTLVALKLDQISTNKSNEKLASYLLSPI